jgi:UDP-N-acetylmuramoyl-tripeptide--D-alanyl-D-alanine ligase
MAEFRLAEIAASTSGRILEGDPSRRFDKFNIDSRMTQPGELFFAIVARRNGHDYVPDAVRRGARGAVISQDIAPPGEDVALVRVDDTVEALQALARAALAGRPVKVIGITGSIGKTTTKEFTASLLSLRYDVLKSEGNLNNHLGLALSLLKLLPKHQVAVLEMAMNSAGEVRALTRIASPDIAVITNVNPVHLEFFQSVEDIAMAKKEILEGTKSGGAAVLNGDDTLVGDIARDWKGRKITFGFSPGCDVQASGVEKIGTDGLSFALRLEERRERVFFPFLYEDYIYNLLAAVGVSHALSVPLDAVVGQIPRLKPFEKRGILVPLSRGIRLVDDSYNSNPKALAAALRSLAGLPARRKVAVLGDMLELGERAPEFHRQAGKKAVESGWDILVTVGPLARQMAEGARAAGMAEDRILSFSSTEEAAAALASIIEDGDLVLVKGSRGVRTDRLVEKLKAEFKEN